MLDGAARILTEHKQIQTTPPSTALNKALQSVSYTINYLCCLRAQLACAPHTPSIHLAGLIQHCNPTALFQTRRIVLYAPHACKLGTVSPEEISMCCQAAFTSAVGMLSWPSPDATACRSICKPRISYVGRFHWLVSVIPPASESIPTLVANARQTLVANARPSAASLARGCFLLHKYITISPGAVHVEPCTQERRLDFVLHGPPTSIKTCPC